MVRKSKRVLVWVVVLAVCLCWAFMSAKLEEHKRAKIVEDAYKNLPVHDAYVYDRSNKAIIHYACYPEIKDGVLYLYDASEIEREDVSQMIE